MIEDAVRELLADRAEHAPVRLDGRHMLERVERRRRVRARGLLTVAAAAAAVGVLVAGSAVWQGRGTHERSALAGPAATTSRPTSSAPTFQSTRTVTVAPIRFDLPSDWTVNDTHEAFPHPSNALSWGPFIGTLRTGPMCWSNSDGSGQCARSHGILDRRPTDGVVAWIDLGPVVGTMPGGANGDPGPAPNGACPRGGTTFHAYRLLRDGQGRYRVVIDGCAYGPRTKEYLAKLTAVANSLRLS